MFGKLAVWMLPLVPRSVVRSVASRYVAGETAADAMDTVRTLNAKAIRATIDILGEDSSSQEADKVLADYMAIADEIKKQGLNSGISIKPSHFAAHEDEGQAFDRIRQLVKHCEDLGVFVRLDMESSRLTDLTQDFYFRLAKEFGNIGVVIQAYLKRSEQDMKKLAEAGANVRLCKGIYNESSDIAYKNKDEITDNYLNLAKSYLTSDKGFLAVATHDRGIIGQIDRFAREKGLTTEDFEFQSLLGVPIDDVIEAMIKKGWAWRVYVPFGEEWYGYSVRRLKENPKIASYVIKHMFGGKA